LIGSTGRLAHLTSDLDQMGETSDASNSVKFTSAVFDGLGFAALYGFGGNAGSVAADNTVGFATNYAVGNFGVGAAYNETRYAALDDGQDGIRNFGYSTPSWSINGLAVT